MSRYSEQQHVATEEAVHDLVGEAQGAPQGQVADRSAPPPRKELVGLDGAELRHEADRLAGRWAEAADHTLAASAGLPNDGGASR
ncbi:hypothetical protein [Streptomyces sp. G45]|uniref:hypothetical protein n=1 Tax=Streptomyces sp. G45 TaxID=3406627 RepID=UPI003C2A10DF